MDERHSKSKRWVYICAAAASDDSAAARELIQSYTKDPDPFLREVAGIVRQRAERFFDLKKNTEAISRIYEEVAGVYKVLVVDLGGIGDLLLAQPGVRALKDFYNGARMTLLCVPRVAAFAKEFMPFDEVVPMPVFDASSRRL